MNTLVLADAYKGYTEAELKTRCRELVRMSMGKDVLIAMLVKYGFEHLSEADQAEVNRICSIWDD